MLAHVISPVIHSRDRISGAAWSYSGLRPGFLVLIAVGALLLLSGCSAATQADNAAEFRQSVVLAGLDIAFAPEDPSRPGVVAGTVRTARGYLNRFVFSFGPGPDKLGNITSGRPGAAWFGRGDSVEYWVEASPAGLTAGVAARYIKTILTLQDIGCRVVADRPCTG